MLPNRTTETNSSTQMQNLSEYIEGNEGYIVINIDSRTGTPVQQNEYEYSLRLFLEQLNLLRSPPLLRRSRPEAEIIIETRDRSSSAQALPTPELSDEKNIDHITKLRLALGEQKLQNEDTSTHENDASETRETSDVPTVHSTSEDPREGEADTRSEGPHNDPDCKDLDTVSIFTDTEWILALGIRATALGYSGAARSAGSQDDGYSTKEDAKSHREEGNMRSRAASHVVVSKKVSLRQDEGFELENEEGKLMLGDEERIAKATDGVGIAATLMFVLVACIWMLEARGGSGVTVL